MGKGLGIAAIILIVLSFPIPVLGTWVGYFALVVAALAALFGSRTLAIATTVLAAIKMYFLSPGLMATMYVPVEGYPVSPFFALTTFFVALPIIVLVFRPLITSSLRKAGVLKGPASSAVRD